MKSTRLAALPASFASEKPFATEYALACVALPKDPEYLEVLLKYLREDTSVNKLLLNVEYKLPGLPPAATLVTETHDDILKSLVTEGLLLVENRREHRLAKLVSFARRFRCSILIGRSSVPLQVGEYRAAQEEAKKNRRNIWEYGDITDDDAKEFGLSR